MIVIELQYDALNRTFTPLDNEAARFFEDGELYLVSVSPSGYETDMEILDLRNVRIAHA